MRRIAQIIGLFVGGTFLLGWAYYEFKNPHGDLWLNKIAGEAAGLGIVMVVIAIWLPFRRRKLN